MTASGKNLLLEWLASAQGRLQTLGYEISINEHGGSTTGTAVDVDGRGLVGTICYWPPYTFEFGFNASESGEEVILETKEFSSKDSLAQFIEELLGRIAQEATE